MVIWESKALFPSLHVNKLLERRVERRRDGIRNWHGLRRRVCISIPQHTSQLHVYQWIDAACVRNQKRKYCSFKVITCDKYSIKDFSSCHIQNYHVPADHWEWRAKRSPTVVLQHRPVIALRIYHQKLDLMSVGLVHIRSVNNVCFSLELKNF